MHSNSAIIQPIIFDCHHHQIQWTIYWNYDPEKSSVNIVEPHKSSLTPAYFALVNLPNPQQYFKCARKRKRSMKTRITQATHFHVIHVKCPVSIFPMYYTILKMLAVDCYRNECQPAWMKCATLHGKWLEILQLSVGVFKEGEKLVGFEHLGVLQLNMPA